MNKKEMVQVLRSHRDRLKALRTAVRKLKTHQVGRKVEREEAEALADAWVEEIRSPLEHRYMIAEETVHRYATEFKRLHRLSRPNNQKTSYIKCLGDVLKSYDDDLILPVQQHSGGVGSTNLRPFLAQIPTADVSEYLEEAVKCAEANLIRGAIVLGWCAVVDRIHRSIQAQGLDKFNKCSSRLKAQASGRFKRFNKEFKITTVAELQEVFDTDLLWILEGMSLIDNNQGDRLRTCFQYRNQSAHPGQAPIGRHQLAAFFDDITQIVLANSKLP